jgi:cytochrome c oxidase assembly factor CtaG
MNVIDYFFTAHYWSISWFLILAGTFMAYYLAIKPVRQQWASLFIAFSLFYMAVGSPLAHLPQFGLHSMAMLQQILLLLVIPVFLWKALPARYGIALLSTFSNGFIYAWFIGATAMWGAHFLSAAQLSAITGNAICGISASASSWVTSIPKEVLLGVLLVSGILFTEPVFNPCPERRIAPLPSVVYLFLSCASCSLLGLWVVFSASSATAESMIPLVSSFNNPLPLSPKADQELAGMLMWVPGCVLYVTASVHILLKWLEGDTKSELKKIQITFKNQSK